MRQMTNYGAFEELIERYKEIISGEEDEDIIEYMYELEDTFEINIEYSEILEQLTGFGTIQCSICSKANQLSLQVGSRSQYIDPKFKCNFCIWSIVAGQEPFYCLNIYNTKKLETDIYKDSEKSLKRLKEILKERVELMENVLKKFENYDHFK